MKHFVCQGDCGGTLKEMGICETDGCKNQWEMMVECDCEDGKHRPVLGILENLDSKKEIVVKDSDGKPLKDGDDVFLIKDLRLRGYSTIFKRGLKVYNIKLTDNPEEVDCKINGQEIVLRVEFLKKLV